MKRKTLFSLLFSLAAATTTAAVLPTPATQTMHEGRFTLSAGTAISYDTTLAPLVEYLQDYLPLQADATSTGNNALVLRLEPGMESEAYMLRILPERIEIAGGGYGGVFNGIQSLFQMLPPSIYAKQCPLPVHLPCCTLDDAPRFGYRGMMLDVARTWIGPDAVKRYIDLLSYHKINKLHLHLTDDEGWRIEIRSHPELTDVGAYRGGTSPIRAVYGKWDTRYGGYFTQDEMRDLIAYASARNIELIPEIDLPGHSRNIARVHPGILCRYTPDTAPSNGYDLRSAWCVAREENYTLLEDILGELCALFPSPYIHIGGDEVEVSQWERCPDCRALMQREGIDAHRLQDRFMERIAHILERHGKQAAVWNEAAASGLLSRTSRVHAWQSPAAGCNAAAKGYPTVVMPAAWFYFDMRQTPREDGHDWAAIFDVQKTYGFDFNGQGFTPELMRRVEGVEGTFFSEAYVSHEPEKPDYLDYMCFPRICALAELAWHGNAEGWETFYSRLQNAHYDRMAAMGIRFRLFPPHVVYKDGKIEASTTDTDAEIFYTLETDSVEHRYTRPLATSTPQLYLFRTRYRSGYSPQVGTAAYYRTITPALQLTTSMGESKRIPYANVEGYKTFARTARACRPGDWIRYDFSAPVRCREIYLQTGNRQLPKTIITTGHAEISYDGVHFERAAKLEKGSATIRPTAPVRALRIVSTADDNGCAYVTIQPPRIKPVL